MPPKKKESLVNENYVFIQAFQLFQEAGRAEKSNFIKALNLYKQSLSLVDSIPVRFPSSNLAIKVAQRQIRLGRSTYSSIKKRIAGLRTRAAREELLTILHDCACNLRASELRAEAFGDIGLMFVANNQHDYAMKIMDEALTSIEAINNSSLRNNSLSSLAVKYAEIEQFDRALTLTAYFSEIADQIRLLTDLGFLFFEKKQREKARQLFNNALELVEREADPDKRLASTAWVAFKLAESREFFWALELSETVTDADTRIAIIHRVAERLIEFGKFATIQEIIKKIKDSYIRAELMASLVVRYSDDGYFTQAREFADAIEVPALKARALLAMAREYKGKKMLQTGFELIDASVKLAYKIPRIEEKVFVLAAAAVLSNEFREERQACDLIRSALQEIECLEDDLKRSEFLNYLVKTCLDTAQYAQARDIISKIDDSSTKDRAIVQLCAALAGIDNIADAVELVNSIEEPLFKVNAWFRIIERNPENRNFRLKNDLLLKIQETIQSFAEEADSDRAYAECAMVVAANEKFHRALQLVEKIKSNDIRDQLLWDLAKNKYRSDFFTEGIEIIRLIGNSDARIMKLIQTGLIILRNEFPNSSFKVEDFLPVAFSFWLEEKEAFDIHKI